MDNFAETAVLLTENRYNARSSHRIYWGVSMAIFLTSTMLGNSAIAQMKADGDANMAAANGLALEEILVTARHREESLQGIPESVGVLTTEMIEVRNITRLDDVINQTSNLFMINDQDPSTNVITIRGITTNRNQPGSVAFVLDGVTQPDTDGFAREYFDLERIEVLKGPQGALYGKNAIGGVISIITKKPGNEYKSTVKATAGDGGLKKLQGSTTGPIIADQLFYRISGSYMEADGYIENTTLDKEADYIENKDLRARLLWEPSQSWSVDLRASYMDEEGGATWFSKSDLLGSTADGEVGESLLEDPNADLLGEYERTLRDYAVKVDYVADWGTITSLTAYNEIEKFFEGDLDNTPIPLIQPASQELDLNAWTQELRFISPTDQPFRYIVGAFYQKTERDFEQIISGFDLGFFGFLPNVPPGTPTGILVPFPPQATESEFEQWAAFAQFNYDVTDKLELSAAIRFDQETREQYDVSSARTDKETFEDWQPKFTLSYDINDNLMAYILYSQGFKSGGFNPPPENFPLAEVDFKLVIESENTEGFELGVKSEWWDDRARLNIAVFYTDYEGLQLFQFDSFAQQVTINVNEVTISGFETELQLNLTENLTLNFSYGETDSEIDDFNGTGLYDGNQSLNTPEYTVNVGAQYSYVFSDTVSALGRLDWRRVGDFYWEEANELYTPGYEFLDLRLNLIYRNWTLGIWGDNVTDERWAVGGFSRNFAPLSSVGSDVYTINQGRVIGMDLRADF